MKLGMFLIVVLLCIVAFNQIDQYKDRHDGTSYYVPLNSPYPIEDLIDNKSIPHAQAFKPGEMLTYKSERSLNLPFTILGTVTKRIVRHFVYEDGSRGSDTVYSYPPQIGVEILSGFKTNFSHVGLPSIKDAPSPSNPIPKDIPPGEYSLEIAVSFLYHGEQRTYPATTQAFRVEPN